MVEAATAGSLIGQKFILNEFVAYLAYSEIEGELSLLSQGIVIFALCGFANLSSIAILLGGLGALAPSRRDEISALGIRALIAATLANLMSAAIAGFFYRYRLGCNAVVISNTKSMLPALPMISFQDPNASLAFYDSLKRLGSRP